MLAAAIALALPPAVLAETGNELQTLCANAEVHDGSFNSGMCLGYVVGVVEMHKTATEVLHAKGMFCMPSGVTHGQATLVVKKYLGAHPEKLHFAASSLVPVALQEAFPCE